MKRLHVHVAVDDLAASIRFYSAMFAAEPTVAKDDYAQVDARRSARELRDLGARCYARPQPSGRAGRIGRRTGRDERTPAEAGQPTWWRKWAPPAATPNRTSTGRPIPPGIAWETYHTLDSVPVFGGAGGERLLRARTCRGQSFRLHPGQGQAGLGRLLLSFIHFIHQGPIVAEKTYTVLVLCTGNSCRSQMAEVLLNHDLAGQVRALSAGTRPQPKVADGAIAALKQAGLPTDGLHPKDIDAVMNEDIDLVVTVCDNAKEACPIFPKPIPAIHLPFHDPHGEPLESFIAVRDDIRNRLVAAVREKLGLQAAA